MIRKLLFFFVSSIFVFSATVFFRLGGFKEVQIREGEYSDLLLFYKDHSGAYNKIAPVIAEVEEYAKKNKIPCSTSFGEYLDNPMQVEERQLRSLGGCIVLRLANPELEKQLNSAPHADLGYKSKLIQNRTYIIARFDGAPSIGPLKVYPKVEEYMDNHNYKITDSVIEIYNTIDQTSGFTEYLFKFTSAK